MAGSNGSTPGERAIREGGPLADSIKDLADYGKAISEQLGQEALARSLSTAAGSPEEQGSYFDD